MRLAPAVPDNPYQGPPKNLFIQISLVGGILP